VRTNPVISTLVAKHTFTKSDRAKIIADARGVALKVLMTDGRVELADGVAGKRFKTKGRVVAAGGVAKG
jgi:hypothetical protein